ncbi:cytochrome P450 52A12 (DH-ALK2) [Scheffersomyces xylosifermentans]|uniref:cytochrome P450 52A12 (DH-ALK2) n=1 Tax=Scheffersomyces xylosifermentans TaxID=1304137 RepID=UPI00315D5B1C
MLKNYSWSVANGLSWWLVFVGGAIAVSFLWSWLRTKYLIKTLGAEPCSNYVPSGFLGLKSCRDLIIAKREGTLMNLTESRFRSSKNPRNPTCTFTVAGNAVIGTKDPENIKALLATQFDDYILGLRHNQFKPLLGSGIFTLDGEGWKHSRIMLRPQFAREQVAHVEALEPHIQIFAKHVRKNHGKVFDIQELFHRLTLDASTEYLFGQSVCSLLDSSIGMEQEGVQFDGKDDFAFAFNTSQAYLSSRSIFQKFYFLVDNKEFRHCIKKVHTFADFYVNLALKLTNDDLKKQSGYVFLYELTKQTRDPQVLRDQLLNILVAGRDTTAGLLSFAFFELARNPAMWKKLKEEVYLAFGQGDNSRINEITFESMKQCEYLKAFLNETLRLYPSVPSNTRRASKNTTLPRGGGADGLSPVLVKKGQSVFYSVYAMHRTKEIYGQDADLFRPERWFEPTVKKLGWSFLPFNGGPRICLGQQFALTEASYVIIRLAQMFPNLTMDPTVEYPPKKLVSLTMCVLGGVNISMY